MSTSYDALVGSDSQQGREPREAKLTEKGEEYFKNQKDSLHRKLQSASKVLRECIVDSEPLPKSISLLENTEGTLQSTFQRYNTCANDYLDFLSRSRDPDSAQELENYWPVMTDLKKQFNNLMEKIHLKIESADGRTSRTSRSTRSSASLVASKRAKAESEKVKLQFVKKETEIKKKQFEKTLQLEVLEQEKTAAAADAEATYLKKQCEDDIVNSTESVVPPEEEMSPFDKTLNYLDRLNSPVIPSQPLSPQAPPFTPKPRKTPEVESSTPGIDNQNVNRALIDSTPHHPIIQTRQVDSSSTHPVNSLHDTSNFLIKKNILLESFQQQQFQDRPDRYIVWKTQFRTMVTDIKCSPLEEISLLTTSIHKDSDAYRLVMSARTSCASNPQQCLHTIWNRMDERFGSAELVEASLKARLMDLPDFMDRKKLYALHDLLTEVETVKNLSEYSTIFSYLDSSLGVKPIIQKLSKQIQEKWVTRATNYKKQHAVLFPPFAEFVKFIEEMSIIRNDPGLMYEIPKETNLVQKSVNKNRLVYVTTRKTDISAGNSRNSSHLCLIHKGSKHTINECIAFRSRSLENRKAILRNHNICLKCCETSDHFAARCKSKIYCDICEESDFHCTALHPLEDS